MKKSQTKKVMKKAVIPTRASQKDKLRIRKLLNPLLAKNKNLSLGETKRGGFQIRRDGDVIIAGLAKGVKVTHKCETKNSKSAVQAQHMTIVPYGEITKDILAARIADKRTSAEVERATYKSEGGVAPCHLKYKKAQAGKTLKATKKVKTAMKRDVKAAGKVLKKRTKKAKATRVPAKLGKKLATAKA